MSYAPLKMKPCYKDYLWGGERLKKHYGKLDAPPVTAESWELACHKSGKSVVAEGELAGKTLDELAEMDRAGIWGERCGEGAFPILVKLIDAKKDLSVQVHPSDATANKSRGEQGKAEMWYIVECEPQSFLYLGFSRRLTRDEFLKKGRDGTIVECMNRVPVKRGDVFFILPGTIHAIGKGILIAEIQQNSDTTFRVYDYGRRDANGNLRELHLERAASAISLEPIVPSECRGDSMVVFQDYTMTEMFTCQYFKAFRLDLRGKMAPCCDGSTFHHLLCTDGDCEIVYDGERYPLRRGDSYLMPSALGQYELRGTGRILMSRL